MVPETRTPITLTSSLICIVGIPGADSKRGAINLKQSYCIGRPGSASHVVCVLDPAAVCYVFHIIAMAYGMATSVLGFRLLRYLFSNGLCWLSTGEKKLKGGVGGGSRWLLHKQFPWVVGSEECQDIHRKPLKIQSSWFIKDRTHPPGAPY